MSGVFNVREVSTPTTPEFFPEGSEFLVLFGIAGVDGSGFRVERIEVNGATGDVPGATAARARHDGAGGCSPLRVDGVLLCAGASRRADLDPVAGELFVVPCEPLDHGSGVPVVGGEQVVGVADHRGRVPKSWPGGRVSVKGGYGGADGSRERS